MRTQGIFFLATRAMRQLTASSLLLACLCACGETTQHEGPTVAVAATTAHVSTTPPASAATTLDPDPALAVAVASDQAERAARQQTLRVQRQLVNQQQAAREARRGNGNERCLAGQRMRRVANGWVQAGPC